MASRANWKGFLRLSLVTCPVALYPATSDSEKISFNQINRKTGHRIKYAKVDADTGEEVDNDDIMKGYKVDIGAICVDVAAIVGWITVVRDDWVRDAGDQFARALLANCDTLEAASTTSLSPSRVAGRGRSGAAAKAPDKGARDS
jgi:hypothetical protein